MSLYEPDPDMQAALATVDSFAKYRDLAGKIYQEHGRTELYKTGWEEFDNYIGGGFGSQYRGELVVLVADTGIGKSTFMTNLALRIAPRANQKMHYISLENPPEDAYNTTCHILDRQTLGEYEKYFSAPNKEMLFGGRPWKSEDLLANMSYMVKAHGIKLFAIDHLNFMFENEEQAKNEILRIRVVMRLLSQFCMNHMATVFVVSHTNRQKGDDLMTLDRIYGSTSIAGAATKVLALNEVKDLTPRSLDIELLKSRYTTWDRTKLTRFDVSRYAWEIVEMPYQASEMSAVDVAERIGQQYKKSGGYIVTQCYNTGAHSQGDRKPSLTIYDGERGYYCYACGESGTHSWLLKQFGIEDARYDRTQRSSVVARSAPAKKAPPPKKDYTTYPLDSIHTGLPGLPPQATEILDKKGFDWKHWETAADWRWHTNEITGWPAGIFIPYFKDGTIVAARLRALEGNVRFFSLPGGESFGYLMDNLHKPHAYVCEGESDTLTLHFLGFPAVGVPGSTNAEAIRKIVEMARSTRCKLIVVPDNDEAGDKFASRLRAEAFKNEVPIDQYDLPGYKDVNDWYVAVGRDAFEHGIIRSIEEGAFAELPPILTQEQLAL